MLSIKSEEALLIIEKLKSISSTNDKQNYLKEALKTYPSFQEILKFTYSNEYQYNVKKLPEVKGFKKGVEDNFKKLLDIQLSTEILAKDKKLMIVKGLKDSTKTNYELLQLILDRNLRIGIDAKTINKVMGFSFIKMFQPMKPRGTYTEDKLPMYGDFKFNGQRTTVEKIGGEIKMFSPSGKIYDIPFIKIQFKRLLKDLDNVRLDCELDAKPDSFGVPDKQFADDNVRLVVNGWMNSVYSSPDMVLTDMDKVNKIRFSIFDLINIDEAYQDKQGAKGELLTKRLSKLENIYNSVKSAFIPNLYFKKPILLETHEEVAVLFYSVVKRKGEGLILKNPNSIYHSGETQEWCKLKNIATTDLEIVDYKLGGDRTKNSGKVTSIICATSCRKLFVTVGSGLKQEDIDELDSLGIEKYRGSILEVTFTNTTIRDNKPSLFLPRLTGAYDSEHGSFTNLQASIRPDKDTADTYKDTLIAESNYAKNLISKLERFRIKHGKSKVYNKIDKHIQKLLKG